MKFDNRKKSCENMMLKNFQKYFLLAMLYLLIMNSCKASTEDLEKWKNTKNGPAKITAVIVEKRYDINLRALATQALIELGAWDHLEAAYKRLEITDANKVTNSVIPLIKGMLAQGVAPGESPNDIEINAKDGLFFMYDYASTDDKRNIADLLMSWATADFNRRYLTGQRNTEVLIEKLGESSIPYILKILTKENELVVPQLIKLIVKNGNEEQKNNAAQKIIDLITETKDKTRDTTIFSLRVVCNDKTREFALSSATNNQFNDKIKVWILRGIFQPLQGIQEKSCGKAEDASKIFAIAENTALSQELRNEAYESIRQVGILEHVPRVLKLLYNEENLYKANAVAIALDVGKNKAIIPILEEIGKLTTPWVWVIGEKSTPEWSLCNAGLGAIDQVEGAKEVILEALNNVDPYVKAGAANVLGVIGEKNDIPSLEKMIVDRSKLKGWIPDTVGSQAQQAIGNINDTKRPASIRDRRRYQVCKLPQE